MSTARLVTASLGRSRGTTAIQTIVDLYEDSGGQAFLTNDRRLTRVTELRVQELNELEL